MKNKDANLIDDRPKGGSLKGSSGMVERDNPFSSNCLRLSPGELVLVGIILALVFCLTPGLWRRAEKFEPGSDYRIPLDSSSDYWLYRRYCRIASSRYETFIVGDSVVWGHYVSKDNTLSHHLNELTGAEKFANLGVDGTHPAALEGLLRYYAADITNKNVILHLNPLWMTSAKADLQTEKEHNFNHPGLVPQFTPKIPCYKASYNARISAVVNRRVPFFDWASHLNITYFQSNDVPTWTLDHPYENPLGAVTFAVPPSDDYDRTTRPAGAGGKNPLDWVRLETSLQWRFFKRSIELLQRRNNKVFVLVGPFNEHMLDAEGLDTYRNIQAGIETWLAQNNIPHYLPAALPPESYRDASHPLGQGYADLAAQLMENKLFNSTILDTSSAENRRRSH